MQFLAWEFVHGDDGPWWQWCNQQRGRCGRVSQPRSVLLGGRGERRRRSGGRVIAALVVCKKEAISSGDGKARHNGCIVVAVAVVGCGRSISFSKLLLLLLIFATITTSPLLLCLGFSREMGFCRCREAEKQHKRRSTTRRRFCIPRI